jgi:formate hydrogenlyase subunit 3/multisubunit Na+/H+ antiporter MnhD subunit
MATTVGAPRQLFHLDHVSVVISLILGLALVFALVYLFATTDIPRLGFWSDVNMAP